MNGENIFLRIKCFDMAVEKEKIWFFCAEKNILCELDRTTKDISILAKIETGDTEMPTYCGIQKVNTKLVLAPWTASKIIVYDLETKNVCYIELEKADDIDYQAEYQFWTMFAYQDCVYLAGYDYPAIIKLNINTMEAEYLKNWLSVIKMKNAGYFIDSLVIGEEAWLSCGTSNLMVKLNLRTDEFQYYQIPVEDCGLGAFMFDGESFWITEWKKSFQKVFRWSLASDEIEEIVIKQASADIECRVHSVVDYKETVILFPFSGSTVYQFNKKSGEVSIHTKLKEYYKEGLQIQQTFALVQEKKDKLMWVGHDWLWHEYDLARNCCLDYEVTLDNNDKAVAKILNDYINQTLSQNSVVDERFMPIKYFINDCVDTGKSMEDGFVGKKIYETMKK